MRLAYLDESGTASIAQDPHVVIAGVIINADRQYKALEKYLADMADEYFPNRTTDAVFHATDIWQGSKNFSRDKFPDKWRRRMILLEICELVRRFDLPVVFGFADRLTLREDHPEFSPSDVLTAALAISAFQATAVVERYMRRYKSDLAMITYENNDIARKLIREVHNYWKSPHDSDLINFPDLKGYLPFKRIIDTAHPAEKTESSMLQIADAMAFTIGRRLKEAEDWEYLFEPIESQLVVRHRDWPVRSKCHRARKG